MIVNRQRRVPVAVQPLRIFSNACGAEARDFREDGVTVRLISDPAMARLNRKFRGKRGPTDVLSFPAMTCPKRLERARQRSRRSAAVRARENGYLGDIAISPETARRNARRLLAQPAGGAAHPDSARDDASGRLRSRDRSRPRWSGWSGACGASLGLAS